jgi:hypothetical protein
MRANVSIATLRANPDNTVIADHNVRPTASSRVRLALSARRPSGIPNSAERGERDGDHFFPQHGGEFLQSRRNAGRQIPREHERNGAGDGRTVVLVCHANGDTIASDGGMFRPHSCGHRITQGVAHRDHFRRHEHDRPLPVRADREGADVQWGDHLGGFRCPLLITRELDRQLRRDVDARDSDLNKRFCGEHVRYSRRTHRQQPAECFTQEDRAHCSFQRTGK